MTSLDDSIELKRILYIDLLKRENAFGMFNIYSYEYYKLIITR